MGIINFIRKMRNFISAALLAFAASAQAGFLTEDYADEGRNLDEIDDPMEYKYCNEGYEERDKQIDELRTNFCQSSLIRIGPVPQDACERECKGGKWILETMRGSYLTPYATYSFCEVCCDYKK